MENDKAAVRAIIENWAKAVREKNIEGILANHAEDFVMFDVPPPFQSTGLEEYKKTWDTFYSWAKDSGVFDIENMTVIAGSDVAFSYAAMRCAGYKPSGEQEPLKFRLTVGLQKIDGKWMIKHEHHSIPSEE